MITIDSVQIPCEFVDVASRWYDGQNDMLYAVCSTGNLTLGSLSDYTIQAYFDIWCALSVDIGHARKAANTMLNAYDGETDSEYYELLDDYNTLAEFEEFADKIIENISENYAVE